MRFVRDAVNENRDAVADFIENPVLAAGPSRVRVREVVVEWLPDPARAVGQWPWRKAAITATWRDGSRLAHRQHCR